MPKHILIAPQSFKGSLQAVEVATAIRAGILAGWSGAELPECTLLPLADGGEGTAEIIVFSAGTKGRLIPVSVRGPLPHQKVTAHIGWLEDGYPTAIIEVAQAVGLPLLTPAERDPLATSTLGVGDMLRHALALGARRIYIGLGGSSTNDGGMGMASSLGVRFLANDGSELIPCGLALKDIAAIDATRIEPKFGQVEVIGLTDVINPLYGEDGATAVYGPQKGADKAAIKILDAGLRHYAELILQTFHRDVAFITGAGAAGGLGAGLLAFGSSATHLASGADYILEATHFNTQLAKSDLVITGEGQLDTQSISGKLTGTVATRANALGIPVICVTGGIAEEFAVRPPVCIDAIIIATDGPRSLSNAMQLSGQLISGAVARAVYGWQHIANAIIS